VGPGWDDPARMQPCGAGLGIMATGGLCDGGCGWGGRSELALVLWLRGLVPGGDKARPVQNRCGAVCRIMDGGQGMARGCRGWLSLLPLLGLTSGREAKEGKEGKEGRRVQALLLAVSYCCRRSG
jgi:hypothetical protein